MSEEISGGVIDQNDLDLDWFDGVLSSRGAIDEGWVEHRKHCKKKDHDFCTVEGGRVLIGSWKRARVYFPVDPISLKPPTPSYYMDWVADQTGEFAAVYNRDKYTIQVVWSIWAQRGRLASMSYPNQISLLSDEEYGYLAYSLPADAYDGRAFEEWGGELINLEEMAK
jgi:hypothetical protein